MDVADYVTLGRTGLRVSPLCLGTMTFGNDGPGGASDAVSCQLLSRFLEAGGNFIDTADIYSGGRSEEIIGGYVAQRHLRDRLVIATKFGFNTCRGNPNGGGNGRKNIYRALEQSLRRLRTDYVDLYYLHAWDTVTPAEEVLATLTDLVRAGRIRHFGISDAPAWYISRIQTLAEREGLGQVCAIQHEYSLLERQIEYEHIPAAQTLGIGLCVWGPLAGGLLSGKYQNAAQQGAGRLTDVPQTWDRLTEHNLKLVDLFAAVSLEAGLRPAQLALKWVATRPGVTSVLIGATRPEQLEDNLGALKIEVCEQHRVALDSIGAPNPAHPYKIFGTKMQSMLTGGTARRMWSPAALYPDLRVPVGDIKKQ